MKINSSKAAQLSTLEYLDAAPVDSKMTANCSMTWSVLVMFTNGAGATACGVGAVIGGTGVVTGSVMQKRQSNGFID